MVIFDLPPEIRTFEGLSQFFKLTNIEGLVFYYKNQVVKVRRDGFLDPDSSTQENFSFPDSKLPLIRAPLWI